MRFILVILFIVSATNLFSQNDFVALDKQTYDYYLRGDYKNLKTTGNKMLAKGIDYYYLRVRMGILAFNKQRYSEAAKHFSKAASVNSMDTISREYNYFSYIYSGRRADANIYLESIPWEKRNNTLRKINPSKISDFYVGLSVVGYDVTLYDTRTNYYEALENSVSANTGFETYFSKNFKGNFAYSFFKKNGTVYSSTNSTGSKIDFSQNQFYAKVTGCAINGWEFSGFSHLAFYTDGTTVATQGNRQSSVKQIYNEYLVGAGIAKNGWRIRTGVNASLSNFGKSPQVRGEGYLTYLPFGNLNLYLLRAACFKLIKIGAAHIRQTRSLGSRFQIFYGLRQALFLETRSCMLEIKD